jgi:hypothetical protein
MARFRDLNKRLIRERREKGGGEMMQRSYNIHNACLRSSPSASVAVALLSDHAYARFTDSPAPERVGDRERRKDTRRRVMGRYSPSGFYSLSAMSATIILYRESHSVGKNIAARESGVTLPVEVVEKRQEVESELDEAFLLVPR